MASKRQPCIPPTRDDPTRPDMSQLRAFVDAASRRYSDELYVMPRWDADTCGVLAAF